MLINYRQAREIVLSHARSFGRETVPLERAFGRVLSETVRADRDYPPFPRATMDGFAMRYTDLESGIRRFRITGVIFAGGHPARSIEPGECYKIMTGAAVPSPADIVIPRENVNEDASFVELLQGSWRHWQNIARQGEDLSAGAVVIDGACICDPAVMGLLATLGRATVTVGRLPRLSILTTGDEVVPVDVPVGPVQIRNSNRWQLEAALRKEGIVPAACLHTPDDPAALRAAVQSLLGDDVLILCGGVSAGDADHVPAVLATAGVKRLFHKIAMRPGKPIWCGLTPSGGMVFALPGNPFSTFVHMLLLIRPYLQTCYGLVPAGPLGLPLAGDRKKRSPLDEFFPVCVHGSPACAEPVALNGSGDIRLGRQANALAVHPAEEDGLKAGTIASCYSFVL